MKAAARARGSAPVSASSSTAVGPSVAEAWFESESQCSTDPVVFHAEHVEDHAGLRIAALHDHEIALGVSPDSSEHATKRQKDASPIQGRCSSTLPIAPHPGGNPRRMGRGPFQTC